MPVLLSSELPQVSPASATATRRALVTAVCATPLIYAPPALAAATGRDGHEASTSPTCASIEALIRFRLTKQRAASGIVIGLLQGSRRTFVAYGRTAIGSGKKVAADTIFEVASLTKVFTALLLADAVVRGEATLDDPLQAYVPSGTVVPSFNGRPITLTDLATHTAALPLRPDNLDAAPDTPNKYASYGLASLYQGLPRYRLPQAPGAKFEYSNVGPSLLGHGLALQRHVTYAELLHDRVTGPLGLRDTRLGDNPAARSRRAVGYDIDLQPVGSTDFGALSPSGGLRSTADDLLTFLSLFQSGDGPGDLQRAARLMLTVDRPGPDKETTMALGWRRTQADGETFYWSDGSGDGSRTFMGFSPARRLAVVALANAATGVGVDDIGQHLLNPHRTVDLQIPPRHTQIVLPPATLEALTGLYRLAPGDDFRVERGARGLLVGSGPGQFPIYPEAATYFFAKVNALEFDFSGVHDASGFVVLHQDGKMYKYIRVSDG